jgi:glutaredoxin
MLLVKNQVAQKMKMLTMTTINKPTLELYYFDACPYCQKVIRAIQKNKIKVNYIDIYEDTNHLQKLIYITGRKTVPCLFIDGHPMHESSDIVEWLEKNTDTLVKDQEEL